MTKIRISKEEMCQALSDLGVAFPPSASIAQLRTLYDDLCAGHEAADVLPSLMGDVAVATSATSVTTLTTAATTSETLVATSATCVTTLATAVITSVTAATTSAITSVTAATTTAHAVTSATYDATETTRSVAVAITSAADATFATAAATDVASSAIAATISSAAVTTAATTYAAFSLSSPRVLVSTCSGDITHSVPLNHSNYDQQLDLELSRLRKQKEILDLRRALLSTADSQLTEAPPLVPVRIDLSVVESMVLPFSGDNAYDVNKWFTDLEDAFEILQFDERARLVGCRRLTSGTASAFLRTISVHNYTELKKAMIKEFGHTCTLQEIFSQLKSRHLKPGESIKRYVIEMQEIASRAAVPETELIDFIIEGLGDRSNNISMLYGAANIDEFKQLLNRYERRRSMSTTITVNRSLTADDSARLQQPVNNKKATVPSNTAGANSATGAAAPIRCFNCSRYGHYQSECTLPKRPEGSCFRCGSISHVYRNCPNRVSARAAAVQDYDVVVEGVNALQMVSVDFISMARKCTDNFLSLFDTGSPRSFISSAVVPVDFLKPLAPTNFFGLGKSRCRLFTHGDIKCKIIFRNRTAVHTFVILPSATMFMSMIVGRDLMSKLHVNLCTYKYKYSKEKLLALQGTVNNKNVNVNLLSTLDAFDLRVGSLKSCGVSKDLIRTTRETSEKEKTLPSSEDCVGGYHIVQHGDDVFVQVCSSVELADDSEIDISPDLPCELRDRLKSLIVENYYHSSAEKVLPSEYKMSINLTHDTPIFCRPRPLSFDERAKVQKLIADLIQQNIIRPSNSPYASPIVLVRKKNGDIRKCVDYRALNKITVRDNHPLPLIDNCLEHLGGKNFFTMLDLKNGFHQVHMHPDSIKYTSFVTPDGQYEYLRMPFGLKNAPPVFQRLINNVLRDLIADGKLVAYLDDILIASKDFESHIQVIYEVLLRLRMYGLELQLTKCKFAYKEIEYLGYRANSKGIIPSDTHLKAVIDYPPPNDVHELQRCLGLFSYFRRFVPSFSKIAYPLTQLTKKGSKYVFDDQCMQAFLDLKRRLIEAPVLSIYNPEADTELHCDASSRGYGAVLLQKQIDKKYHPVAYFSKTASASESKLHSYVLETLSVVYALRRFHTYLDGIQFKIVTDCNSLVQTLSNRSISAKIARWALEFESYNYVIQYRSGVNMSHVDALSRVQFLSAVAKAEADKCVNSVYEVDLDFQLQVAQNRDPGVLKLRRKLEEESVNNFELVDGLVFHRGGVGNLQLVVPSEMIENVIRMIHEKIGHLGIKKSCCEISKHYWFNQMKNRVQNFIKNCLKCIVYSSPSLDKKRCTLYSIPKGSVPFDTIHVDHVGPLPSTSSKRKYVLVIVDAFTKFTKIYPAVSTSTRELCDSLETYFSYYSRPIRIVSDRGSCFTSLEFDKFVNDRNIQHIKTAVAAPRANGQVERVNREVVRILSKLAEPVGHSDWIRYLSRVEFALNNSIHSTTLSPPSKLLFGVEQRGEVVDELTEYLTEKLEELGPDRDQIRAEALKNIEKSQESSFKNFQMNHSAPVKFKEGDYVMITNIDSTVGSNKKLIPRYRGPYVISKQLLNDRYVVKDIDGCQVTQLPYNGVIDSTRIKLWKESFSHHSRNEPSQSTLITDASKSGSI